MSIVVTCNLSDGVILGADSAITIQGNAVDQNGQVSTGVLKVYKDAKKIHKLYNLSVGILSFGLGYLGLRSIESFIKEFETINSEEEFSKKTISEISEELRKFFCAKYEELILKKEDLEKIPENQRPLLGIVVAGYSPEEYLPEVNSFSVPSARSQDDIVKNRDKGNFGSNWFGMYEGITRLIKGYDINLLNRIIDVFVKDGKLQYSDDVKEKIGVILSQHEHQIPYAAMPLEEGIRHVKFLLELVVNQTRFVVGAPICDEPIYVGVIERGKPLTIVLKSDLSSTSFIKNNS